MPPHSSVFHMYQIGISSYFKSQAGTYIKEFVHGDLGRTHPRYEASFELTYTKLLQLLEQPNEVSLYGRCSILSFLWQHWFNS